MDSLFVFATLDAPFLHQLAYGAYVVVNIAKWAALLFAVIKLIGVGFAAMSAQDNPAALGEAKDKGGAVLIGLAIVLLAFSIQSGLATVLNDVSTNGKTGTTVNIKGTGNDSNGFENVTNQAGQSTQSSQN